MVVYGPSGKYIARRSVTVGPYENSHVSTASVEKARAASSYWGYRVTEPSITISVTDENDNIPLFTQTSFTATLDENVPLGTIVDTVQVQQLF